MFNSAYAPQYFCLWLAKNRFWQIPQLFVFVTFDRIMPYDTGVSEFDLLSLWPIDLP